MSIPQPGDTIKCYECKTEYAYGIDPIYLNTTTREWRCLDCGGVEDDSEDE